MKFILSILFLFIFQLSKSQAVYCPPNIDFENGNYGYWKFFRGTCCPISTPTAGQAVGRHTLTSGPALDPIGGFPILAPGGGSYSLKLTALIAKKIKLFREISIYSVNKISFS